MKVIYPASDNKIYRMALTSDITVIQTLVTTLKYNDTLVH